jgi:cytochrome c oxidase cbb3-type subunit 1
MTVPPITSPPLTRSENPPDKFDDTPVKWMLYPAIIFMILGMTFGAFIAFNAFIFPDYFSGEYIHFGKIRPVHVWHVLILWLLAADIGLFYYFVPRLCGVPLWSTRIAYCSIFLWWISAIPGVYSFPWGTNFGWEYAELPKWVGWLPVKPLFIASWLLFAINLFATIASRVYEKLYVSLWYCMGVLIWASFTLVVGSYAVNWVPGGMSRVNTSFFYIHNLVGLIFTPMGLATAYYALPKLAKLPIFSHRLSMVGFWAIAFDYAWVGAHHIIHGPVSQWLQTVSIIFSIWLFTPVFAVVLNLFATLRGHWELYNQNAAIRFLMLGNAFYLITCVQGPLMALRNVNEITSKTDWIIGHSHISLYGTFTFFAIAGIYQAIPIITKKPLWSKRLADLHFSFNIWGSIPFIFSLWIGGFLQGVMWASWADGNTYAEFHNQLAHFSFLDSIVATRIWWIMRGIGGLIVLVGNLFFVVNIFNTVLLAPRKELIPQKMEKQI